MNHQVRPEPQSDLQISIGSLKNRNSFSNATRSSSPSSSTVSHHNAPPSLYTPAALPSASHFAKSSPDATPKPKPIPTLPPPRSSSSHYQNSQFQNVKSSQIQKQQHEYHHQHAQNLEQSVPALSTQQQQLQPQHMQQNVHPNLINSFQQQSIWVRHQHQQQQQQQQYHQQQQQRQQQQQHQQKEQEPQRQRQRQKKQQHQDQQQQHQQQQQQKQQQQEQQEQQQKHHIGEHQIHRKNLASRAQGSSFPAVNSFTSNSIPSPCSIVHSHSAPNPTSAAVEKQQIRPSSSASLQAQDQAQNQQMTQQSLPSLLREAASAISLYSSGKNSNHTKLTETQTKAHHQIVSRALGALQKYVESTVEVQHEQAAPGEHSLPGQQHDPSALDNGKILTKDQFFSVPFTTGSGFMTEPIRKVPFSEKHSSPNAPNFTHLKHNQKNKAY